MLLADMIRVKSLNSRRFYPELNSWEKAFVGDMEERFSLNKYEKIDLSEKQEDKLREIFSKSIIRERKSKWR